MTQESTIIHAEDLFPGKNRLPNPHNENKTYLERRQVLDLLEINRKKTALFFREHIETPPDELLKKLVDASVRLKTMGFDNFIPTVLPYHYLNRGLSYIRQIQSSAPPNDFFDKVDDKTYPSKSLEIKKGLYLIDTTERPNLSLGIQGFIGDHGMEEFLEQKKVKNKLLLALQKDYIKDPPVTRFNLTANEINKIVLRELSGNIFPTSTSSQTVRLPRYIELNLIGNICAPQLGRGNTEEWFGDDQNEGFGVTLVGGKDLKSVRPVWKHHRSPTIGFRPMIFFPY